METVQIRFTQAELKALQLVIGNGYADGDIYQDGFLDTREEQKAFISGSDKINRAITYKEIK